MSERQELETDEQPWFIRIQDATRLTGLAETTIREAIYRGDLRARKFRNRGWLIERDDLKRWIEAETESNVNDVGAVTIAPLRMIPVPIMQAMRPEDI
jgi:DNA binding domain, excisionase family